MHTILVGAVCKHNTHRAVATTEINKIKRQRADDTSGGNASTNCIALWESIQR